MRATVFAGVLVSLLALSCATPAPAQVADGELVFTAWALNDQSGLILAFDPRTMTLRTIGTQTTANSFLYQVDMAPGNVDLVVSQTDDRYSSSGLFQYTPTGIASTIVTGLPDLVTGMDLDGDDQWLVSSDIGGVFTVDHRTGAVGTVLPAPVTDDYEAVTIVREGGVHYAVANLFGPSTTLVGRVYDVNRGGITGTIHASTTTMTDPYEIMFADTVGQLMTSNFVPGPTETEVSLMTLGGAISTLASFFDPEGLRSLPDNTMYIVGNDTTPLTENTIRRYDLATGAALQTYQFPQVPLANWLTYGLTIYGRRVVTCTGQGGPGGKVNVIVQSHRANTAGANYQLACSLGRRPGVKLPNGEWLMLDVTDPLFFLTSTNLVPTITQQFSGTLNASGRAVATVSLPASLPPNLGVTVFCGGVVYAGANILQVTNVHWFEL